MFSDLSDCPWCTVGSPPPRGSSAEVQGRDAALQSDVPAVHVVEGFAAYEHACDAVGDGDDGRAADEVVAGGHGQVVGAGCGDGEEVAGADVAGERYVVGEDVAGLAVPADDGDGRGGRWRGGRSAGGRSARRKRGAGVVAHAAVDCDEGVGRRCV